MILNSAGNTELLRGKNRVILYNKLKFPRNTNIAMLFRYSNMLFKLLNQIMISMHKWGKNPTEQSSAYSNWLSNTSIRQDWLLFLIKQVFLAPLFSLITTISASKWSDNDKKLHQVFIQNCLRRLLRWFYFISVFLVLVKVATPETFCAFPSNHEAKI